MSSQAQTHSSLNHFNHPHPLYLIPSNHCLNSTCSGCNSQIATGMIYSCRPCNYFLHTSCAKMPQQITHPFDPKKGHFLILRVYGEGSCSYCDACGKKGTGFVYHCKICQIDLHIRCASTPMSLIHQSHPHKLKLLFSPTHHDKKFHCDVCHANGSNQWLYRCDACDFDVHLDCKNVPIQAKKPDFGAFPNQTPGPGSSTKSVHHAPPPQSPQFHPGPHFHPGFPQAPNFQPHHPSFAAPGIPGILVTPGFDPAVMAILQRLEAQNIMNQQQIQALLNAQRPGAGRAGGGMGGMGGMGIQGLFQVLSGSIPGLDMSSLQGLLGGGLDFGSLLGGFGFC